MKLLGHECQGDATFSHNLNICHVEKTKWHITKARNIRGKKAELSVKEANVRKLDQNNPGLVLTGLSNFKHLGDMLKQLGVKLTNKLSSKIDIQSDSVIEQPQLQKVVVQFDQVKCLEEKFWRMDEENSSENQHILPKADKFNEHIDKTIKKNRQKIGSI